MCENNVSCVWREKRALGEKTNNNTHEGGGGGGGESLIVWQGKLIWPNTVLWDLSLTDRIVSDSVNTPGFLHTHTSSSCILSSLHSNLIFL